MNDLSPVPIKLVAPPIAVMSQAELLAELTAQLEPIDVVERIWIADIAALTARANILRGAANAVRRYHAWRLRNGGDDNGQAWSANADELVHVQKLLACDPDIDALTLSTVNAAFTRLLGMLYTDHLDVFHHIESFVHTVTGERDRIIDAFEKRRQAKVSAKSMEVLAIAAVTKVNVDD